MKVYNFCYIKDAKWQSFLVLGCFSLNVLMAKHMHTVPEKTKEYTSIKY